MGSSCKTVTCELWSFHKIFVIILIPVLFLPMIIWLPYQESYCGYVLIVMSFYWIFEAMPMAATSLLPLVLFPILGVMTASQTAVHYFKDTSALLMGGLLMAIAIESWNLHRRIALAVLMVCGTKPRWLLLGFMSVTGFLSMWISNTATTSMMLPIAEAVLLKLSEKPDEEETEFTHTEKNTLNGDGTTDSYIEIMITTEENCAALNGNYQIITDLAMIWSLPTKFTCGTQPPAETKVTIEKDDDEISDEYKPLAKAMMLCICYSASIGGTATLIGTTPQLVLLGQLDDRYGAGSHGLNFVSWLIFSFPSALVFLLVAWLCLLFMYLDLNPKNWRKDGKCAWSCSCKTTEEEKTIKEVIRKQYKDLGQWSWAEMSTLVLFTCLCILWIFRDIGGYGWASLFPEGYISDATPAILIGLILFVYPAQFPNFYGCRIKEDTSPIGPRECLLNWKMVQTKMPWLLYLLLGGGFALAEGCEVSGLSKWVGDQLAGLGHLDDWVIVLICTTVICFFTEVTSNTAVATIFLPILIAMAESICMNPMYIGIPSAILVTYAFMLPVATAPNALVFANGALTIPDMAFTGFILSSVGILWITFWLNTYGAAIFDVSTYPDWARVDNTTCVENATASAMSNVTTLIQLTSL
ncbi:Na(+)/citrate cotransporter-like [Ptychodera flava]|uniref:Na(+)/citrate cotransporter-like n=1 Tax=Ptychodera flava TaxID=63121 RepID=UPI00396A55F6